MTNPLWRKSSHSGTQQGDCVEVADLGSGLMGLRDSKHPDLPHLAVTSAALSALVARIKCAELDR
jgi:hypothetical protein